MALTGSRFSLTVETGRTLTAKDVLGSESEVALSLVVTTGTGTGTRRTIRLGEIPAPGERTTLVGSHSACASGCRLAAVELAAAPGVDVDGDLDLSDLRVDGRPVDGVTSPEDWNTTEDECAVIRPSSTASGALRLLLSIRGIYPATLTPAWMPRTIPALLPAARRDPFGLEVTGVDGSERPARSAGRVILVPAMPRRSALVDLDALTRGAEVTFDAHAEVWLVDDPGLVTAVTTSLRERGIAVADVRRHATIRQTYQDTVPTWSLALGAVVGPAAILVALLILLVLAVTGWRDRARDLAVLRLNGAARAPPDGSPSGLSCRPSCSPSPPASARAWSAPHWRCPTSRSSRPDRTCPSWTRRRPGPRSSVSPRPAWCCCRPRRRWRGAPWPAELTWNV